MREYYCTITLSLTNPSQETLTEINRFLLSYVGEDQVGRSKKASFRVSILNLCSTTGSWAS